ncbi:MAG: class II fructose-1,6-bisphosphate aldolase [Vulcanimicrobiaceae bacterium]
MPVVPMKQILDRAFEARYGVPAINILNDLTLAAALDAAVELRSPLIVQTSVKTVKWYGASVLHAMFREMTRDIAVPVSLHLDHCPDRTVISECLKTGWNAVLFDAHELTVEENRRQTIEVVAEARRYGASVEGEIEGIEGVEDDLGSDEASAEQPLDVAVDFIRATGIDCFAPAIGNKHGEYKSAPKLNHARVSELVAAAPIPMVLHGGTGLAQDQFDDLIRRGCAKVNISTALKVRYLEATREFQAQNPKNFDPPSLFKYQRARCKELAMEQICSFHSDGKAA